MTESPERISISTTHTGSDMLEAIEKFAPGAVQDGVVDLRRLAELSGLKVSGTEGGFDTYGLLWAGKSKAVEARRAESFASLAPDAVNSMDWDSAENIFIEGDNLEVLKLLQKSYNDQIKVIYIDPPYNTGSDFVYNDDFSQPLQHYLEVTGQADSNGNRLVANTEVTGRKHSNWLSMMYPRLILGWQLLSEDGVMFISIGEDEVHNLRLLCEEAFGPSAFVAQIPWRKRTAKSDVPFGISQDYEWILCFAQRDFLAGASVERKYYQTDDYLEPWRTADLTKQTSGAERPNSAYTMVNPRTGVEYPHNPNRAWSITKDTFDSYYSRGKVIFPGDYEFLRISGPVYRVFKSEDDAKALAKHGSTTPMKSVSTQLPKEVGLSSDGNADIVKLFGTKVFSFPKPVSLVKHLLSMVPDKDALVLDFFGGSGTTAQAVLESNAEDGGSRRFIVVTLDEKVAEGSDAAVAGFSTISELARTRIQKVMHEPIIVSGHAGLKCCSLAASNFTVPLSHDSSQQSLLLPETLNTDALDDSIALEAFLKSGVRLDAHWSRCQVANESVIVAQGVAVVLARVLSDEICQGVLGLEEVHTAIFLEDAFASRDAVKANAYFAFKQANKTMKTI